MKLLTHIIPKQNRGAETKAIARKKCTTERQAIDLFRIAAARLMDINNWGDFASKLSAHFSLTDNNGVTICNKTPEAGNLIRIQLPGPPNIDGSGYDWVRIEKIEEEKDKFRKRDCIQLQVRPVENPFDKKKETQAHLYTIDATSTFAVIRKNKTVWVFELGRHELVNNHAESFVNKVRNLFVSIAAFIGLSTSQWKLLINGILTYPYSKLVQKEPRSDYRYSRT